MVKAIIVLAFVASAIALPRPFIGKIPHRIVGGEEAIPHEFPFQISLQYFGSHICGGTIYNADTVITAAHCGEIGGANVFKVAAGKHNLRLNEPTQQVKQVIRRVLHPGYPGATGYSNDICVMKLESPLEFNAAVGPIPMAPAGHTATGLATVIGWGATQEGSDILPDTLRKVDIPIITDTECRQLVDSNMIDDSMICAGFPEGGKDSCQGDSGGPFLASDRGTGLYLAGIVSWGYGCARPGYPGVYAEVSHFSSFIAENL